MPVVSKPGPRVTIEDGCKFKGSIDMDAAGQPRATGSKVADLKPTGAGVDDTGKAGTALTRSGAHDVRK